MVAVVIPAAVEAADHKKLLFTDHELLKNLMVIKPI
jgi:hypothetical protein